MNNNSSRKNPKQYETIIGIDPDAEKNGIATLNPKTRKLTATAMSFADTLDYLRYKQHQAQTTNTKMIVVIEAGWLNKAHWHIGYRDSQQAAAAKGNAVGRNHETGRKLAEMCQHWEIDYQLVKPLALTIGGVHLWNGKDGKITAEELKAMTGLTGRTNQEARDAALIAWSWADLPMRILRK